LEQNNYVVKLIVRMLKDFVVLSSTLKRFNNYFNDLIKLFSNL